MPYYKLDGSRRLWSQEAPREARHVPEQIVKAMRTRYTTRCARVQDVPPSSLSNTSVDDQRN